MITAKKATKMLVAKREELSKEVEEHMATHHKKIDKLVAEKVREGISSYSNFAIIRQSYREVAAILEMEPREDDEAGSYRFEIISLFMGHLIAELEKNGFEIWDNEADEVSYMIYFGWAYQ